MGITFAIFASMLVAFSNLSMRRSIDSGGTSRAFLLAQQTFACFLMILLNPVRTGNYEFNIPIATLGLASGVVLGLMMLFLGKSVEKGPSSLTFAALNASTVVPGIVMALLFGAAFGHTYTFYHAIGSLLIVAGLFWAGWEVKGLKDIRLWATFISLAFCLHVLLLLIMQWRALLITSTNLTGIFHAMSQNQAQSQWYIPMLYLASASIQIFVYLKHEKRIPNFSEIGYGLLGGFANGGSTLFLIKATEFATPIENAMIFPIFSVMTIIFCNVWSKMLYKEPVHWKAMNLCTVGLFIGTVNWETILGG